MGFKDKFREFFTSEEEEEEEVRTAPVEEPVEEPRKTFDFGNRGASRDKVVNFGGTQLQVVLVKPERFEDAPGIADHLNAKRTVVLNLESAPKDVVRRLVDFLSGVAYANKGQIKRAANNTFVITPNNVDVSGDVFFEEHEGGYYR
ncbi:MAG: cell division protein SepF [Clostridia bacterium]|nr:cell division protein SepF [Clostridia bacterium]